MLPFPLLLVIHSFLLEVNCFFFKLVVVNYPSRNQTAFELRE